MTALHQFSSRTFYKKLGIGLVSLQFLVSLSPLVVFAADPIPGNCDVTVKRVGGEDIIPKTSSKNLQISKSYESVQFVFHIDPAYTFDEVRIVGEGVSSQVTQGGLTQNPAGLNQYSGIINLISSNGSLLEVVNQDIPLRLEQRQSGGDWTTWCSNVTLRAVSDEGCSLVGSQGFSDKVLINLAYSNFRPSATYKVVFENDSDIPEPTFQTPGRSGEYQIPAISHTSTPKTVTVALRRRTGSGATEVDVTENICQTELLITNEQVPPDLTRTPVSPIPTGSPWNGGNNNNNNNSSGTGTPFAACNQAGNLKGTCESCFTNGGVWTGVGCIPVNNTTSMVNTLLTIGLGISGAVVVIMTLAGGFLMSTSQGDLKRVEEARSLITSAISGILFIIFSITILRFIGVSIFRLPGF